jgi:hypothetical protein
VDFPPAVGLTNVVPIGRLGGRALEPRRAADAQQLCSTNPHEPPRASPPGLVQWPATRGFVVEVMVGIPRWHARGQGFMRPQLHSPSRVRCARCVPAAWTGAYALAANLQISRPARQRAPAPSQGGSAGSNPVGATRTPARSCRAAPSGDRPALRANPAPPGPHPGRSPVFVWALRERPGLAVTCVDSWIVGLRPAARGSQRGVVVLQHRKLSSGPGPPDRPAGRLPSRVVSGIHRSRRLSSAMRLRFRLCRALSPSSQEGKASGVPARR